MTCQFMCDVVYNVGVVQPPSLVLPPTLDVDTRLPLKVRQGEVVSEVTKKDISTKWGKNKPPGSEVNLGWKHLHFKRQQIILVW